VHFRVKRYLLLEKVTVITEHREGGPPCWRLTRPVDQHGVGVHTWRAMNGAWIETMWHRRNETNYNAYRVRMIDEAHRLPGLPGYVELYQIIGETEREAHNFGVEDVSRMLLAGIRRAEKL
jgi:hypothetical protein